MEIHMTVWQKLIHLIKLVAAMPDLSNTQLEENYFILFVDGSWKKNPNGPDSTGYTVVTLTETLKGEPLPKHYSAQAAKLRRLQAFPREKGHNLYW